MPHLVLGPLLRYVGETEATVWVETDTACEVTVLGATARTFTVGGHHYALLHVRGLEPGTETAYEVALDGERRWPEPDSPFPPSVIRTSVGERPIRLVFGSCRVSAPHDEPWTQRRRDDPRGREVDALRAVAERILRAPGDGPPDRLLLLGDQVYADDVSPRTLEFIRARRDTGEPPGEEVADFEEYTALYREAWSDPVIRWLLSTVATAMLFDDHDVLDDWNISESWVCDMRELPWWDARITGAFMSYWIYQHIGNLPPADLEDDAVYAAVCDAGDATALLEDFARRADRDSTAARWSFCEDMAGVRLLAIDTRAGRVLRGGRRSMLDEDEWAWVEERLTGGMDHLLVATTLPLFLDAGLHDLETWNEAVCDGAWGRLAARAGEAVRRAVDLEHWAAFRSSFDRLVRRIGEVGAGVHGPPPATITVLSGDVHHAYLSEVAFRRGAGVQSHVWQAVCSPFRNPLGPVERSAMRFATSRGGEVIGRALARSAGVRAPDVRWRMVEGPWFDNQVATLDLHGRGGTMTLEATRSAASPELRTRFTRRLA